MPAYMIADVKVTNPHEYERYKQGVPRLIAKHGGRYLVRGGECEALEGNWKPTRLIICVFPDREAIQAFLSDPEYQPLMELRHRIAESSLVAVEGL